MKHPYKIIYKPTPTGNKPFEHIYMDIYAISGQKFLTVIDNFSKFATGYPINETAIEICQKLIKLFSHHGTPCKITTDNAQSFKSNLVQDLPNRVTLYNTIQPKLKLCNRTFSFDTQRKSCST